MKRTLIIAAAAALALTACSGLKDAFSAHTGVVARAADTELTATQLGDLMAKSHAPINKDVAKTIANLWINYRLLAQAAVDGDSLSDPKQIDEAMWPMIANLKARKFYETLSKNWGVADTAGAVQGYASGKMLAAEHILFSTPQGTTDANKAAIKARAEALRSQVNASNFAAMAKANSQDPGTAQNGGSLGIFPKGQMVPAFENAVLALKPGEISPVVTTQYGYHIIRRPTYDEVKSQLLQASKGASLQKAESTYLARVEASGDIQIKSGAAATMHAVGADPESFQKDKTVLATSKAGDFTAERLVGWAQTFPPQTRIFDQLKTAPDSILLTFLKTIVKNDLVLREADSAKVEPDAAQLADMHKSFVDAVVGAWTQLGISPAMLADSAKSKDDRLAFALRRIDSYFGRLIMDEVPFVQVPTPVVSLLRDKYSYSLNDSGLDRGVELATKARAAPGASAAAGQPPTAVPLAPAPGSSHDTTTPPAPRP